MSDVQILALRPLSAAAPSSPGVAGLHPLFAALFDEVDSGLVVCDGSGGVLMANQAARDELASQRLLRNQGGVLACAAGVAAPLDAALRQAAGQSRRRLLLLASASDRLMVSIVPIPVPEPGESMVLVQLGRREPCSPLSLELFGALHGLTLAERGVLRQLLHEATPREIADELCVALSTVRSHIASIRSKLGVRSIEALLLRAVGLPPMASALRRGEMSLAA